jgi:hypothetical protein
MLGKYSIVTEYLERNKCANGNCRRDEHGLVFVLDQTHYNGIIVTIK